MSLTLIFLLYSTVQAHPIQPIDYRAKRAVNLTREEQKYFPIIYPSCGHSQESYKSLNMSTRLYEFIDPKNAAIASIFNLKHQAVCVNFKCDKCGALMTLKFEFFDTGKKWTFDCSGNFVDELNILYVNYGLDYFGQVFNALSNSSYKLASNNCLTWTYDFYCKVVNQCVEAEMKAVGFLWRTFIGPTFDLLQ